MRIALPLAWCCFASCWWAVVQAGDDPSQFDQRLRKADSQFRMGNYKAAYELASAAVRSSPEGRPPASALQLLATICHRSGRVREALQHGEQYMQRVDHADVKDLAATRTNRQEVATILADAYGSLGQVRKTDYWFDYALRIPDGQRLRKPAWEAEVRLNWAKLSSAGDATRADALYRQAAEDAHRVLRKIDLRRISAEHRTAATEVLVQACLATGRLAEAQAALEALLSSQRETTDRAETLSRLADLRSRTSEGTRNAEFHDQALELSQRDVETAKEHKAQALERWAAALERQAEREPDNADALYEQARGTWRQAAECYETLCESNRDPHGASVEMTSNLQRLQELYKKLESWEAACRATQRLLVLRQATLLTDDPSVFRAKTALGIYHAKCGRLAEAAELLDDALQFWRSYRPKATKELTDTLQNLAELARENGKYDVARGHLREALQILEASPADDVSRIECHLALANVFSAQADYEASIREYQAAEAASSKDDDAIRRLRCVALLGCAAIYKTQPQFDRAIDACGRAWEVSRGLKRSRPDDQVSCLITLAALHLSRYDSEGGPAKSQDLASARAYIEQSDKLSGNRDQLSIDQRCQLLHVLALSSLREAQSNLRDAAVKDPVASGDSCLKAIEFWREAARLGESGQLRPIQARSMSYMAEAELLCFDFSLALAHASRDQFLERAYENSSRAIDIIGQLQAFPGLHYRALLTRAKVLRRQAKQSRAAGASGVAEAKIDAAIKDLKQAVRTVEAPRSASLGSDRERAEFFSQFVEAYELLVTWLTEQQRFDEALAFSQISRNRTFIEQVQIAGGLRAELAELGKSDLLQKLQKKVEVCDRLRRQVQQAAGEPLSPEALRELDDELIKPLAVAQSECDRMESALRQTSHAYRNLLRRGLNVEAWDQARTQIVGSDGLLLVYHLGPTASQLFVVTPDSVDCHDLKISAEAAGDLGVLPGPLTNFVASDLVSRYLQRRGVHRSRGANAESRSPLVILQPLSPRQSVRLAELVLPEGVRSVIRKRHPEVVTVVPDGSFHRLPLESLLVREEPESYILDDPEIPPLAYAPSAMVLSALRSRPATDMRWPPSLLTVGNPKYQNHAPLPSSDGECRQWAQLFATGGSDNVRLLLGGDATEGRVRREAAGRNIIHFAVHGDVDVRFDSVFAASLVLTPGTGSDDDDGFLYLNEVYALPLEACELTVLSACDSNVGANRKLEAGASLTRAFLSAGARRVVASLWLVDDASTAEFMGEFAKAIRESLAGASRPNYAQALQQARRHVKQNKNHEWADPYHWAPFVLIGPAD
jgi:tetratricopeptide (TPR) repeat protein